ncbi:hypothetical protein GCM10008921_23410 [Metaclostridioides mangenotii]|nr:hypothetical protein [Clostridioides mangenotii]
MHNVKRYCTTIKKYKYTGSNKICRTKFKGRIDDAKGIFPFDIPVKIRYQSVHGVTSSINKPICKSTSFERKTLPNIKAIIGVHIKLMIKLDIENFILLNELVISFISIPKNIKNNKNIKSNSIKCADTDAIK